MKLEDLKVGDKIVIHWNTFGYWRDQYAVQVVSKILPTRINCDDGKSYNRRNGRQIGNNSRYLTHESPHISDLEVAKVEQIIERRKLINSIFKVTENISSIDKLSDESLKAIVKILENKNEA